ncbi:MAG: nitroreductase family protein [Candidatus Heimdallarchaeota archaeon]|nr:nitroreductase family protein [Candidatus Heimdallarchaeota archaeon]MCK5184053.1 nitroreductase family protein [Candidatus Heimdallarchaeota archaeon]
MSVKDVIEKRRAYRALEKIEITKELIQDLASHAQLSASCFNSQPWNFVFVFEEKVLNDAFEALKESNEWAKKASMVIAVFSKNELDCVIGTSREYYLFDTGMATAYMILRGTELGLVMHPIAGYSHSKIKNILGIPEDMTVITLIIVGKKGEDMRLLSEKQVKTEENRPVRKELEVFVHHNSYKE